MKYTHKAIPMAEPYIYERIWDYINRLPKNSTILDIATGQGYISEKLYQKGFRKIHTADINSTNFKLNKKTFHFKQVDANQTLPYKDNSFDIVISSETIEHLKNPLGFLDEINRILKPGKTFILTTPNVTGIISRIYFTLTGRLAFHTPNDYHLSGHIAITPDWLLKEFFTKTNFRLIGQTYSSFYLPIIKKRYTQNIFKTNFFGWVTVYKLTKNS